MSTAMTPQCSTAPPDSLLGALLREQNEMTAVDRFAASHREVGVAAAGGRYAALLPSAPPGPGQHYAFEVDLDRCSGCKACVTACHALNGLDERESWRSVGMLQDSGSSLPILQHVTSSCHHCLDPACLSACPVDAYEKDPVTGIVRHLDDQCFGCTYCTLACPYGAPKYNASLGIVRKCDMCAGRLAEGQPPACVQACPHDAIAIRLVEVGEIRKLRAEGDFLPATCDPADTGPTTIYRSANPLAPQLVGGDHGWVRAEHSHWALVFLLVLSQAAVGIIGIDALLRGAGTAVDILPRFALATCMACMGASLVHLGRPWLAYRAVIGIRHSWLSREVAALGAFAGLLSLSALRPNLPLSGLAALVGAAAVGCSVMIYHVVRRPAWSARRSGPHFFGSAAVLGLAASWPFAPAPRQAPLLIALAAMSGLKLAFEASAFRHLRDAELTAMRKAAILMRKVPKLRARAGFRFALGLMGGVAIPLVLAAKGGALAASAANELAFLGLIGCFGGEILERNLFFAASSAPSMPRAAEDEE
jgi:formate dehydrogenase iron-sulfur subunit